MRFLLAVISVLVFTGIACADDYITETQVKDLIQNWLNAQNSGSFQDYANTYAGKFHGIRRTGSHTYKFNRDAWLKDRAKMFKNKMTVKISDPEILFLGRSASVKFEQLWQSQSFTDTGHKLLLLTLDNGKPKIVREEMLSSKVLINKKEDLSSSNFPFAFAIKEGIVIERPEVDPALIKIKPKLTRQEQDFTASVPVDANLLTPEIRSLIGMDIRLYSKNGVCESKIKGFSMVSKEAPHFGQIQRWKEEKTPTGKIAAQVFSAGYQHLVATTDKCSGDFAKAPWLPRSPIAVGRKADKVTQAKVRKAFKASSMYKKIIKPYEGNDYQESIKVFTLNLNGKPSTWISIYVTAGEFHCGDSEGELGSLWQVMEGTKEFRLRWVRYLDEDLDYATDLENDGMPEFYYKENFGCNFGFIRARSNANQDLLLEEIAFHDCPC